MLSIITGTNLEHNLATTRKLGSMCSCPCSHGPVGRLTLKISAPTRHRRVATGFGLHFQHVRLNVRPVAGPAFTEATAGQAEGVIMNRIIDAIEKEQQKSDGTQFAVGDSVRVHTRVVEGDKERIQIFAGIVIGRKGRGLNETVTVRRISYGEGVERVFPLHSPRIAKIEVEKEGRARRAKLNYLRTRKGKEATAVRE